MANVGRTQPVPKVIFVALDGSRRTIDGAAGDSVMATAVRNGVPGIVGECGGNRSCATCHVYVDDGFAARVGPPDDLEDDMLDLAVSDRRDTSRLSCQIKLTDDLDGLTVHIPDEQP
ncbi:2Fe-2S iron-sulfur cluster-binding protein [Phytohabitans suffuscus]|uniref:2Fe-2S iron-sulfur cluster-binding protein n=1 Tax=Phytohabitans suffuscus TaxID=624315 RepID=UPI0018D7EAB0|nr:2Fe-2S iron-sulfur cluster-binding protein [Phytohabitans suffuscus]